MRYPALAALFALAPAFSQEAGSWTPLASLRQFRVNACAVTLRDGGVFISGGETADGTLLASSEIVSPDGSIRAGANLNIPRAGHTCTLMQDGRILLAGGGVADAEIHDTNANTVITVRGLGRARRFTTATLLNDGRVLFTGGLDESGPSQYVEYYDPLVSRFQQPLGQMSNPRTGHTATLLSDGRVALVGGTGFDGAPLGALEIFDPLTDLISSGMGLSTARTGHAAALLEDGRLLVTGGRNATGILDSAEILDPAGRRWTNIAARLREPRAGHSMATIPGNGSVLIAGGGASSELFQPAANTFRPLGETPVGPDLRLLNTVPGTAVAVSGTQSAAITFLTLTFGSAIYHQQEMIVISGTNFTPGTPVNLTLQQVERGALTSAQVRLLTPQIVPDPSGRFPQTNVLFTIPADVGRQFRVTATQPQSNLSLTRAVPVKLATVLTVTAPASLLEGQRLTVAVDLRPLITPPPSGLATVRFGSRVLSDRFSGGTLALTDNAPNPGIHTIGVYYPGDDFYEAAFGAAPLAVVTRTPVIELSAAPSVPEIGRPFALDARVRLAGYTDAAPPLSGAVTIFANGAPIATGSLDNRLVALAPDRIFSKTITVSTFDAVRYHAAYSGDPIYRAATSNSIVPTIQRAKPVMTLSAMPNIFNLQPAPGQTVRYQCGAPLAFQAGLHYPALLDAGAPRRFHLTYFDRRTGLEITGSDGAGALDGRQGNASGVTTLTLPIDASHVRATFRGDDLLSDAVSNLVAVKMLAVPVRLDFKAELDRTRNEIVLSASLANAVLESCHAPAPTGDLEFREGDNSLGVLTLPMSTVRIPKGDSGLRTFMVRYFGDDLHERTDASTVLQVP